MASGSAIVTQIQDDEQLLRYAAAAQIAKLPISQRNLSNRAGMLSSRMSEALHGKKIFTEQQLKDLDLVIGVLDPGAIRGGGLASFAAKLRANTSVSAHVPSTWTPELLEVPELSAQDSGMAVFSLLQGSALLAASQTAGDLLRSSEYRAAFDKVVNQLLLVGLSPPTARSVEALLMIGNLARYGFAQIDARLGEALSEPLGFRVWRAFTTIVRLSRTEPPNELPTSLIKERVRLHLRKSMDFRSMSLYPARSLDLELAMAVPRSWSLPPDDWAGRVLESRADRHDVTVRERAMAATSLWERAVGQTEQPIVAEKLTAIIDDFEQDETEVREGLRWAAATLRQSIAFEEPVCNNWPSVSGLLNDQVKLVTEATAQLSLPAGLDENASPRKKEELRAATQFLIQHAVLQNSGTYARRAVDTLRVAGWGAPAAEVLGRIAADPDTGLRARSLFAIGYMMDRAPVVHRVLLEACEQSWGRLRDIGDGEPSHDLVSEAHAALFAIGDCFGAVDAVEEATRIREDMKTIVDEIVSKCTEPPLYPVARAACYMIAFTGTLADGHSTTLLRGLSEHKDKVTRALSRWALNHRISDPLGPTP
jgi:hypothetical protein